MAKRTRYPNRTSGRAKEKRANRPSDSAATPERARPIPRPDVLDSVIDAAPISGTDMPARSSSGLTEAEVARAEQLEAEATAKEKAAIAESLRRRTQAQARELAAGDVNAPLSVRAAHEYAYVARDVKRIALTAALMVAILAVLHVLVNVLGVISL